MRFRGRASETTDVPERPEVPEEPSTPPTGPFDVDDLPDDGLERVDLGALLIHPEPGVELRLQVDERTGVVQSAVLAGPDAALELRAFAAPRGGDLWSDMRARLAADVATKGGTTSERTGRFGTELLCQLPGAEAPGAAGGVQHSRVLGITGPRWLLRATLVGQAAHDTEAGTWEDIVARVAVRRGAAAMPPGDQLPLVVPAGAQRVAPPGADPNA